MPLIEDNKQSSEVASVNEDVLAKEEITQKPENSAAPEQSEDNEYGEGGAAGKGSTDKDEQKKQEKPSDQSGAQSSSAGGAGAAGGAAAVVAVVVIATSGLMGNINANFRQLEPSGSHIDYDLQVAFEYTLTDEEATVDFENLDTGLRLVISGEGYEETIALDTSKLESTVDAKPTNSENTKYKVEMSFVDRVENLKPKTRYQLEVISIENGSVKNHLTKSVKTTGPVSAFHGLQYKCQCSVDGNLYYDLNIEDDAGYYSDFTYTMVSKDGGSKMVLNGSIADPHQRQAIDVSALKGQDYLLTITYATADPDDTTQNITQKSHEYDVQI